MIDFFHVMCYANIRGDEVTTGQRIRAARKAAGMTQKELGEKMGLSFQSIAQWENDLRKPKYDTLKRIAAALGVNWDSLAEEDDPNVTHMIWEEIREEMYGLEPLTDEEAALNTLLNSIGYNIAKARGEYYFTFDSGSSAMTESDLKELLSCAQNGLKVAAKTLELKLLQRNLPPNIQIELPPEDPESPSEDPHSPQ